MKKMFLVIALLSFSISTFAANKLDIQTVVTGSDSSKYITTITLDNGSGYDQQLEKQLMSLVVVQCSVLESNGTRTTTLTIDMDKVVQLATEKNAQYLQVLIFQRNTDGSLIAPMNETVGVQYTGFDIQGIVKALPNYSGLMQKMTQQKGDGVISESLSSVQ